MEDKSNVLNLKKKKKNWEYINAFSNNDENI